MNSFLSESWTPPAVVNTPFMSFRSPTAAACFMKMVASPDQKEHIRRSGFACWMAAIWDVKLVSPSLGKSSSTGLTSMPCRLRTAW